MNSTSKETEEREPSWTPFRRCLVARYQGQEFRIDVAVETPSELDDSAPSEVCVSATRYRNSGEFQKRIDVRILATNPIVTLGNRIAEAAADVYAVAAKSEANEDARKATRKAELKAARTVIEQTAIRNGWQVTGK